VITRSGKSLADDFRRAIVSALQNKGVSVTEVEIQPSFSRSRAREALVRTGAEKLILLTLREWKSDTYNRTALTYDVELTVLDSVGSMLAKTTLKGRDNLGGSFWNPPDHARDAIPNSIS
jgi:hypothetical protein